MKNRLSALMIWILVAVLSMGTASSALARHDQMQNGQSSEGDPTGGFGGPSEFEGTSSGGAPSSSFVVPVPVIFVAPLCCTLSFLNWSEVSEYGENGSIKQIEKCRSGYRPSLRNEGRSR